MRRGRHLHSLAALSAVFSLALAACGGGGGGGGGGGASPGGGGSPGGGQSPAAGSQITVMSLWGGAEEQAFQKVLQAFEQKTGVKVKFDSIRQEYGTVLQTRLTGGNPPDVAIIPGIGTLRQFARNQSVKKITDYGVDRAALEGRYPAGLLNIGVVDNELYGIPVKYNSKSTIWYRPDQFKELGVQPPKTWDEFKQLLSTIQGKGETPMALGAKDDWTLTDWFESIYLRQNGPEAYDKLFSADGDWTDPSVANAANEMKSVLSEKNVVGGINAALGTGFVDAIGLVFSQNPRAPIYYEGGFVGGIATGQVNKQLKPGETIDFFDFPDLGQGGGVVNVGADVIAGFTDKPGVKEFIEYVSSAEGGEVWAKQGTIISPVKEVSTDVYPNELAKKEAQQLANAQGVRMDGSDLLPSGAPGLGAELQKVVRGETVDWGAFQQKVKTAWENE